MKPFTQLDTLTLILPAPARPRFRTVRTAIACSIAILIASFALTEIAHAAAATGTIAGRVIDGATFYSLAGARISIPATGQQTYTDSDGDYALGMIPAGRHTVVISYVGYTDIIREVGVGAAQLTQLDAAYEPQATIAMEKYTITGALVGTARAINRQRASETLANFVAADAIGQFPDQNAAESLQRIPGVSLYRDQGEGRFVIIRGINSQYNRVTLNGATLASPENGSRNAPLDVIGSDSLSSIEVIKVNTPDIDAEGLGGSANLRNSSAFDNTNRTLSLGATALYNNLREKWGYKFNVETSAILAAGKLGLLLGASYQDRPYGSNNYEDGDGWTHITATDSPDGREHWFFNQAAFREYDIDRTRASANFAADYKPTETTLISLRATYADFKDEEERYVTIIPFDEGDITGLTDTGATIENISKLSKRLRTRTKQQKIAAGTLAFKTTLDALKLDAQIAASQGKETKDNELEARFDSKGKSTWRYDFSNTYDLRATWLSGEDPSDPAIYTNQKSTLKNAHGSETEYSARANARYDFGPRALAAYLKTGLSHRAKEKELYKDSHDITDSPADYNFAALSEPASASDYPYFSGPRMNKNALRSLFFGNRARFTLTEKTATRLDNFTSNENVTAAYLMGGLNPLQNLALTAGARMERTRFDTDGHRMNASTDAITPTSASASYTNWLPALILRHDITKNLVLRASYTNTLSRPDFTQTALARNENDDRQTVSQGNPALKPMTSRNYDASIEYYLPSLGLLSASLFRKELHNFTYQIDDGIDAATGYDLTTYVNGPDGAINGLELAWQQQLRFLPAPLDGLGLMANLTLLDSSATYPTRPGENLPFIGQSKRNANLALTYQKKGFFIRLALNHRSPRLREDETLGYTAATDRYVDNHTQLDFTTSYRIARRHEIFLEVVNITNEPFRVHLGNGAPKRFAQFEEYDWSANIGVKIKL
ncbi:MAG: TonB-dependent receptor [Opitutaceae bacterium]|jgi:TonB-dependent receptor|nr:TonB-dependent receptor [Opitutaceae bacterium]